MRTEKPDRRPTVLKKALTALLILAAGTAPAFAHLDPGEHGSFLAGFSHPLFGTDHILAMVAVGLWAALLGHALGGRALWLVPSAFVVTMAAGFAAAMLDLPLPFVEPVILASVVVIGLLAAVALKVPTLAAMGMVGFFAFFHGHAHGGELGEAGAGAFAAGFIVATALLHADGVALGLALARFLGSARGRYATRAAGAATALGGLWLAFGG
jgi:urease accessory protein